MKDIISGFILIIIATFLGVVTIFGLIQNWGDSAIVMYLTIVIIALLVVYYLLWGFVVMAVLDYTEKENRIRRLRKKLEKLRGKEE